MKRILLFITFLSVTAINTFAQTNTWIGGSGNSFGTPENWSLGFVPGFTNQVVIPTGNTVVLSVSTNISSITLQGNATLSISANLIFTNPSTFEANTTITWSAGVFGGGGTLTNSGIINLTSLDNKIILGGTTLNNSGTININSDGDLYINDGTINNQATGIIDLKANDGNIYYSGGSVHILNNNGLIKKSAGTGLSIIYAELNNNNSGTIQVQTGTLEFNNALTTLSGGTYTVSTGAVLKWASTITCSGTLSGVLSGRINWIGSVSVAPATPATFNFTGTSFVDWSAGVLLGGGVLNNNSRIDLTTANNKIILGGTTLNNNSIININDNGGLYINEGTINNQATGIIDLKANDGNIYYSGGSVHILNNNGLIKKSAGTGLSIIYAELNNNNSGTIQVQTGTLEFNNALTTLSGGTYTVSTGAVLKWASTITCSGTLSGVLSGRINWIGSVSVAPATPATFNFTGTSFVDWSAGVLLGGGVLNNNSRIDLTTANNKIILGGTTLNNNSIININDNGGLYINEGTINNQATGIIDLKANDGNIYYSGGSVHILNNNGLIKKSAGTGLSIIYAELNNNNSGTIQVQTGTLEFNNALTTLSGGTYTVSTGAVLKWANTVTCSGTLSGVLSGRINWIGSVSVAPANSATFNFTGTSFVDWSAGVLIGGGVFNNNSRIDLTTANNKIILGGTTLNNAGTININSDGDLYINDGTINNQATGIIDLKANNGDIYYSGGTLHVLNNNGIIQKTLETGFSRIYVLTNNSGTIKATTGTLEFAGTQGFNNTTTGIVKGIATLDVPLAANFTNNGTFAPGASPGTLTVIGDFKSTATSVLEVELNGSIQSTQYDLLAIQGNAVFNGIVNVSLGFAPLINDTFIVATTTGTITQCGLASTTTTVFGGFLYTFSVECLNDNQVVLRVTQKTLGIATNEFNEKSIVIFPNPTSDFISIKNTTTQELMVATIIDLSGRILKIIDLKGIQNPIISFENFATGNYLLRIEGENNNSIVKKIMKK